MKKLIILMPVISLAGAFFLTSCAHPDTTSTTTTTTEQTAVTQPATTHETTVQQHTSGRY
jgi:uncharacterized lipoprotein YajG